MTISSPEKVSRTGQHGSGLAVEHLMADLGRRAASGGAIAVGAQLVKMGLQLMTAAILARLLEPEDFGLVAMAATVTIFVSLFTDLGLSTATIQRREIEHGIVSAFFYINLTLGVFFMVAAMAAAPLAAWFFGDARVFAIVIATALTIPVAAASVQHSALLQRGMRWKAIQWTGLLAQCTGAAVAILLAWRTDIDYWALVAQTWVSTLVGLAGVWLLCPWRPGRLGEWSEVRAALRFGLHLTGFNLLNYLNRHADDLLIGWRWGASELGFYTRAYQLLVMPLSLISGPVGSALVPALSRLQGEPERWRRAYLEALGAVVLVSSGMTAALIATAEPLVAVLFGPGWSRAADVFTLLSISMFAATPMNAMGWIYLSLGQSDRMFRWGLIATPLIVGSFAVGLPFGAVGVAMSYSCTICALALPCIAFASKTSPVRATEVLRVIALPTAAGILSALVGIAGRHPSPPVVDLLITAGLTLAVYFVGVVALLILDPVYATLSHRAASWLASTSTSSSCARPST
jgi:PST family polysaccharide transporter